MTTRKRVLQNVFWSCLDTGIGAAVGFVVAPYLVHHLGQTTYGLWVVLGSLTSYFGLLDLGVRGAVSRHIALHHAGKDWARLRETLSTALALLAAVAALAFLGVLGVSAGLSHVFAVPAGQAGAARAALLVVGLSLGLSLLGDAFDATLWGLQRVGWVCTVNAGTALLRAGLTFALVRSADDLLTLAGITLATTACSGLVKAGLVLGRYPALRPGPRAVRRRALGEIFGYGIWNFLLSVARLARGQLCPLLIGATLGVAAVTPFALSARLVATAGTALLACTAGLIPLATQMHARGRVDQQRRLLLVGGKYTFALSLYLTSLLVVLGGPLLRVWVGPELAGAAPLLAVLALGELLPGAQFVSSKLVLAAARHRPIALLGLAEVAALALLAVGLVGPLGLTGVCLAVAVPAVLCRGVALVVQGCRILNVPLRRYLAEVFLLPLVCAAGPAVLLALAAGWNPPRTWAALLLYGGAYTAVYALVSVAALGLPGRRGVVRTQPGEAAEVSEAVPTRGGPAPREGLITLGAGRP
jgi:O-antigen/teichoic acid export membrane protein